MLLDYPYSRFKICEKAVPSCSRIHTLPPAQNRTDETPNYQRTCKIKRNAPWSCSRVRGMVYHSMTMMIVLCTTPGNKLFVLIFVFVCAGGGVIPVARTNTLMLLNAAFDHFSVPKFDQVGLNPTQFEILRALRTLNPTRTVFCYPNSQRCTAKCVNLAPPVGSRTRGRQSKI